MKRILVFFLTISILACDTTEQEEKQFRKRPSSQTNIDFKNELRDTPQFNILTYLYFYNGAGVAAGDFNNDGLADLYFTSNQGEDKLYLNRGGFEFEDITQAANIKNTGNWTTGVTHVDINNDGLLDIYVCKVGGYGEIQGKNLLYVNQGLNAAGLPFFKEEADSYGLAFSGFSTQASFFDYDLDGDLDMYLMNHSVHPSGNYGKGSLRQEVDARSGDKLYRNENGRFTNVSEEAGIFQGKIGYGLGLGISDLNNDGYPDIYIGNDFFENDYLYLNQKDGTFKEIISSDASKLGHTTHFSMGNDIADINNDGLTDLVSLDMLPEDLETYKASGVEYPYPTYEYNLKNGYAPQYMQNTLHLNLGDANFSEIGNLSGISATEWSWGALLADYDNDGFKDLFITNGIKGATNDMDFINFIANDNIQERINRGMASEEMAFIDEIPEKKVSNYFFRNQGDLTFSDMTTTWFQKEDSFSNGCTYADLDGDGDLDLVVNNVDEAAFVLENTTNKQQQHHFLKVNFEGDAQNGFGLGAKVIAYMPNTIITQENFVSRGYLSAVPKTVHLGLGQTSVVDSLRVIWPGGKHQTLRQVPSGELTVRYQDAMGNFYSEAKTIREHQITVRDSLVAFAHKEGATIEFSRNPLVPFANTHEGPSIAIADVNGDALDDFFIGGPKGQASAMFIQDTEGAFTQVQQALFELDAMSEDVSQVFFDANLDGSMDLLVVSGGNEFRASEKLRPRLYLNFNGIFKKDITQFQSLELNASKVAAIDFNKDGAMDIAISSDQVPHRFGESPAQYLFKNDGKGNFEEVTDQFCPDCKSLGNVKDFLWADVDGNGFMDLIAVGYWMPITILKNNGVVLVRNDIGGLQETHGWWNSVIAEDFDQDGDLDFIAGNWGLNSKFKASTKEPITLYSYDFDGNGSTEPLVTYFYKGKETPFASKDELVKQMPFLNKEFLSYKRFASARLEDLFSSKKLQEASKKKVYELASCYFENRGDGSFLKSTLPVMAQASTVQDMAIWDFDRDGYQDVLLLGNNYEISTQLGRMDASHGILLRFTPKSAFTWDSKVSLDISGPIRSIEKINVLGKEQYIIGRNNDTPLFLAPSGLDLK
ncbi:VCBS repeat-containing protein [Flavobacteriaceae bacterium 3-367]